MFDIARSLSTTRDNPESDYAITVLTGDRGLPWTVNRAVVDTFLKPVRSR